MKKDKARQWTDKELEKMERNLKRHYKQATAELTEKWNKYMERARERISGLQAKYDTALKGGDQNSIREAKERLEKAKRSATLENERYKNMVDETTEKLAHVNEIALDYVNGKMPKVYTKNYNQVKGEAQEVGIKFNIVDETTVERLVKTGDIKLPKKKVNIPKDMRWNTKQLNSSVLQGILQGESMDKIAKRILPIVDNNRQAAIRNARTMVTGAENVGRLDSYRRLQENGAILKKVWIATHDSRVRAWHLDMDGQEADIDDMFTDGNGNELAYPADPSAAGETVYNCRCSMTTRIVGFKKK
jgi:SPP1 gp7 family putative phage head morphogenesis protein